MIRKFYEYFFEKINYDRLENSIKILTEEEKRIFNGMCKYDKLHSINVYYGILAKGLDEKYLKLALLHDVGKNNAGFLKRVFHKFGLKTNLRNHCLMGYDLIKNLDVELANLILIHHDKDVNYEMKIFQGVDDVN